MVLFRFLGLHGVLRTEGLRDRLVRLDVGAADQVDAVGDGREDAVDDGLAVLVTQAFERLGDRLGTAGQVDDERGMVGRFAKDCDLAREDRRRDEVPRDRAHLFAEARHLARGDSKRRLGRHVAASGPRSARREDEVAADDVDQLTECLFNVEALIGDEALVDLDRRGDRLAAPRFQVGNALVVVDAAARAVGNRDEAEDQFVVGAAGRLHDGAGKSRGRVRNQRSRSSASSSSSA